MRIVISFTQGVSTLFEFEAPLLRDFPLTETFKLACDQFGREHPDVSLFDVQINIVSRPDAHRT